MTMVQYRSEVAFFVPTRPIPKQSARFGRGRVWQPKRITENAKLIRLFSQAAARVARWHIDEYPIAMEVHFLFKWPKGTRKEVRQTWALRTQTPDTDNLLKQFMDSTMGFWEDDRQVAIKHLYKWNAPGEGIACRIQRVIDYQDLNSWNICEGLEWIMETQSNNHPLSNAT